MEVDLKFKLTDSERIRWERFWHNSPHTHPKNHLLFAEVERATGHTPVYATGKNDGEIVCAGVFSLRPMLAGGKYSLEALCQRGPIFDDIDCAEVFLSELVKRFKTLKVGSIRISPYWLYPQAEAVEALLGELGFSTYHNSTARTSTGIVDLRSELDEIFASLKSRTRQEIRRADKLGVIIRPAVSIADAEEFYKCLSELHHKRSLFAISRKKFEAMCELIFREKELGILLNAYHNSTFLGGLWVVRDSKTSYHSRFVVERKTLSGLSNLTIGPALWWQAIQWAKEKGCTKLNVEGYKSDVGPEHPKYYIYRVKGKFNPKVVQIIPQYQRICCWDVYAVYKIYEFFHRCFNFAKGLPYKIKTRWNAFKVKRVRVGGFE